MAEPQAEPRTWTLSVALGGFAMVRGNPPLDKEVEVVEAAAYDELQRERDEIQAGLDQAVTMANDHAAEIVSLNEQLSAEIAGSVERLERAETAKAERDEAVKLLRGIMAVDQKSRSGEYAFKAAEIFLSRRVVAPED